MSTTDHTSPLHFRLWTVFAVVAFLAYVCGAVAEPSYWMVMPLAILLILLLGGSVVAALTHRGATRVFWATFAMFGFAQCVVLQIPMAGGRRSSGYLLVRRLWHVIHTEDMYALVSIITIPVIILIATLTAYICTAVYVVGERRN